LAGATSAEVQSSLSARREARQNRGLIVAPAFRTAHAAARLSIAEAVYAALAAPASLIPLKFICFDSPSMWAPDSGAAISTISSAIVGVLGPVLYTLVNLGLAKSIAFCTPAKFKRKLPVGRPSQVWLDFEGAHGFWGRVAFAVLFAIVT